MFAVLLWL